MTRKGQAKEKATLKVKKTAKHLMRELYVLHDEFCIDRKSGREQ